MYNIVTVVLSVILINASTLNVVQRAIMLNATMLSVISSITIVLSVSMLNAIRPYFIVWGEHYADCHYDECRHADCRCAHFSDLSHPIFSIGHFCQQRFTVGIIKNVSRTSYDNGYRWIPLGTGAQGSGIAFTTLRILFNLRVVQIS